MRSNSRSLLQGNEQFLSEKDIHEIVTWLLNKLASTEEAQVINNFKYDTDKYPE
jgi:hypothetical protein